MSTLSENNELTALIASRICHDLANPIGAIYNGLELLELGGFPNTPELELVSASVQNAQSKLNFFRVAFGPAQRESLSLSEVHALFEQRSSERRCKFHWAGEFVPERPRLKLILLICLCAETSLPIGGTITVRREEEDWLIEIAGDRVEMDPAKWDLVTKDQGTLCAAADIHFNLTQAARQAHGFTLTHTSEAGKEIIRLMA